MFKITNDWLMNNRTKNGGWTKKQAEILSIPYPFKGGWRQRIIGCFINNTDRVNFESAAHITCKTKKVEVLTIDRCIDYLADNKHSINKYQHLKLIEVVYERNKVIWKV